jgi:hypothetical protein
MARRFVWPAVRLAHHADIAAIPIGRVLPAILVVIGHALIDQRLHVLAAKVSKRPMQAF